MRIMCGPVAGIDFAVMVPPPGVAEPAAGLGPALTDSAPLEQPQREHTVSKLNAATNSETRFIVFSLV